MDRYFAFPLFLLISLDPNQDKITSITSNASAIGPSKNAPLTPKTKLINELEKQMERERNNNDDMVLELKEMKQEVNTLKNKLEAK